MSEFIERIFRNSAETFGGWNKLNENKRTIRIGNSRNCNDDGLIYDLTIEKNIKKILDKYSVDSKYYELNNIHTKYEYSSELIINEDAYQKLAISLLLSNKPTETFERQMTPLSSEAEIEESI